MEKWSLQLKEGLKMKNLVKADFKKTIYIPSYRYLLLTTVLLSLLFGLIFLMTIGVTEGRKLTSLSSLEVIDVSFLGIDVAAIMMIIFAALFISKDVADGAVHTNLAITPNRLKFFLSKLLFHSLLSLLISTLVISGIFAMDWVIMSANNMGHLEWMNTDVLLKVIGSILMVLVYSLLSAIGAFFIQTTAGGIVFSLSIMFLPALVRFFPEAIGHLILPIFPETAIGAFVDITTGTNNLFIATLILFTWLIVSSAISYGKFRKINY